MEFQRDNTPISERLVDTKIAIDPRINAADKKIFIVNTGARNVSQTVYVSNNVSQSSISFTCPPPSTKVFVDREVLLKMTIPFTFTRSGGTTPIFGGTGISDQLFVGRFISSQSYPLHNLIGTLNLKLNNTTVSQQSSDFIDPLMRYNSDLRELLYSNGSTPTTQDQAQTYNELTNFSRNPLTSYGDSVANANDKRGSFLRVLQNDNNVGRFVLEVTEPLIISPLLFNKKKDISEGLIGVSTFDVTLSLNDAVQRCLSIDTVNFSMSGITATYDLSQGEQTLSFTYLSPPENIPVPNVNVYQYAEVNRFTSNIAGTLSPGQTLQYTANAITLNYVPKRIFLYARRTPSYDKPLVYLNMYGLSINFNNVTGILSSASEDQLIRISQSNGLNMSALQWRKYTGSVMCVQFDKDISLPADTKVGMTGQYQFQPTVLLKNISSESMTDLQFFIVVVGDGLCTIRNQTVELRSGVLDDYSIFNRKFEELPLINYEQSLMNRDFSGGSFMSSIKNFGKKALDATKKYAPMVLDGVKKYAPKVISAAEKALPLLLALGYDEDECHEIIRQNMHGKILKSAGLTGGELMEGSGLTAGIMAPRGQLGSKKMMNRRFIKY